ncbi:MAG: NAD(P)/FAD-dependent oxidoreductase [Clostridiales Family XIII bacterium]|nr:NAD(P)/FAD-dependent oxidoreductase [Clostridiales Family XIII bacterium]
MPRFDHLYDAIVIGGGVLGCFATRSLSEYRLKVALLERERDLCGGITKANSAIIYAGYDNKPGTLKARMCVSGARDMQRLCTELSVPFRRCGSLMVAAGSRGEKTLARKYADGLENGVPDFPVHLGNGADIAAGDGGSGVDGITGGFGLLSGAEARRMEPALSEDVTAALYASSAGTLNPWALGLAAAENAAANGAKIFRGTAVTNIARVDDGYRVETTGGNVFFTKAIVNAAGIYSDKINELVAPAVFRIVPERADFIILDTRAGDFVKHIIFCESEIKGKDVSIVPTVDGNLLIGDSTVDADGDRDTQATSKIGLDEICKSAKEFLPGIPLDQKIRSFAGLRPNPFEIAETKGKETKGDGSCAFVTGRSIHDFLIGEAPGFPGFINFIGIKTPGLTCANEIGKYAAELVADRLGCKEKNPDFDPKRRADSQFIDLDPEVQADRIGADALFGRIVCRCRKITEREIRNAISGTTGATTVGGVKRRTGACMGRCQGGYCTQRIIEILSEELGVPVDEIILDQEDAWLVRDAESESRNDI